MKRTTQFACAMLATLIGWQLGQQARADDDRRDNRVTPCQSSSASMFKACRYELKDDYNTTRAKCAHIADWGEKAECRATLRENFYEGRQECSDQVAARIDACELLGEYRYLDPIDDPSVNFVNPDDVPSMYAGNPYVSVVSGRTLLLRSGEDFEEAIVIHVTDEIREVQGVFCRIVWDVVLLSETIAGGGVEYEPVEVTEDWFALTDAQDVYYCGEAVRDYEDGIVTAIDGSFEAGTDYARGGILTQALPMVGLTHRQEMDLGNAEDIVTYLATNAVPTAGEGGENPSFPCAPGGCLKTFDFATLDPGHTEHKYYLAGTGFVLAVGIEDGELTGEREELVCAGDSLAVLRTPDCGLAGPDALLETICELVPDALCE